MSAKSIRIFCADDTDIAVEGMRRILESAPDLSVVGHTTQRSKVLDLVRELVPDVVLLDLRWPGVPDGGSSIIRQLKQEVPGTCIVAITIYDYLIAGAKEAGADDVVTKDISAADLQAHIRAVYQSTELLRAARERLDILCRVSIGDWRASHEHEDCVFGILRYCFEPELSGWQAQVVSFGGVERSDIICSNFSQQPLWATVRQIYDAQQIVFEVKNVHELTTDHIEQLSMGLGGQRGRLGFLVGRRPPGEVFRRALYWPFDRHHLVILWLADEDLVQMVDLKARGRDPTDVVQRRLEMFIRPYAGRPPSP